MNLNTMWLGDTPEGRWTIPRRTRETRQASGVANQPVETKTGLIIGTDAGTGTGRTLL